MWMIQDYIAIVGAGILLITAIAATIFFFKKRGSIIKRQNSIKNEADSELQRLSLSFRTATDNKVSFDGSHYNFEDSITVDSSASQRNLLQNYTFEEIQKATENFSSTNLIEGSVYHGRLNGEDVAIKSISAEIISRIDQRITHHPNIIKILGTCVMDGRDSFMVLEYASNGSLKDWIHGGLAMKNQFISSCNRFLNWNQRLKICQDTANALQFLHNAMNVTQIHLCISNIFLDDEFNAKISCLAPEYVRETSLSPSVDVFAFGLVVMEVISGRRNDGGKICDEIKKILRSENAEELREWMDGRLGERYSFDGAVKMVNLARSCVEDEAAVRPNAGEISAKLLSLVEEAAAEGWVDGD